MLPRAAARALRTPSLAAIPHRYPVRSSLQCNRAYADDTRSPKKDNTWKRTDPIVFGDANQAQPTTNVPPEQPKPQSPQDQADEIEGNAEPQKPQKPLPDLRQGIPSTFAAEFARAEARAKEASGDANELPEDPLTDGAGSRDPPELPKSAYETSTDRRRNRMANWSSLIFVVFGVTSVVYMGRNWDTEEEEKAHADTPNGWGLGQMYERAVARINGQKAYYTEPTFQKLLPDKDKIPGGVPELTLVLSLEDLLLHSEWSTNYGYRLAKRPGLDYFLRYLNSQFELVIFTSVKSMDADPIIRKLDPFRLIMWPLYREATRFEKGDYIKDLSYLNRDLSKVIVIDTDPSHVKLQPENAIVLPKWKGQPGDDGLVALIPFLEYLAMMSQTGTAIDVRKVLKSMKGHDIPKEYARREAKLREQFQREIAEQKRKSKGSAGGMFMKSLGLDGTKQGMVIGDQSLSQGMSEGKMMIDMYRDFNKQNYEHLDKQIRENGEQWLREMAEEDKRMQEAQLKDMKAGAFGWLGTPSSATIPSAASAPEAVTAHQAAIPPSQLN